MYLMQYGRRCSNCSMSLYAGRQASMAQNLKLCCGTRLAPQVCLQREKPVWYLYEVLGTQHDNHLSILGNKCGERVLKSS